MFWMLILIIVIALLIYYILKALDNDRAEFVIPLVLVTMFISMILGVVASNYTMVSYDDYIEGNYKGVIQIATDEKGNIIKKDTIYTKELKWW